MEPLQNSILVVDDELSIRESFKLILEGNYFIHLAATGESALKKLVDEKIDVIFLDVRMPGLNGLETLKRIKEIEPAVEVVMVTAVNDVQKAGEAIRAGAADYVVKPFDVAKINNMVETVLKKKAIAKDSKGIRKEAEYLMGTANLIGNSDKMQKIISHVDKIAKSNANLLITGPAGTEKETIANVILKKSHHNNQVLVVENIQPNQNASKLKELFFGKGTGSSTVSLEKQTGILEKASGGILFINNIDNLPQDFQVTLSKVLSTKQFNRQDYSTPIKFNCRIIAATLKDLEALCKEGKFERLLLTELSQEKIKLPPLKARSTDIPLLVNSYVEELKIKYSKKITGLTKDALDILSSYKYPGNLLELKALVELLVLQTQNELIQTDEIPIEVLISSPTFYGSNEGKDLTYDEMQKSFERNFISQMLEKTSKDVKKTAQLLGIAPRVLSTKMETLGIN